MIQFIYSFYREYNLNPVWEKNVKESTTLDNFYITIIAEYALEELVFDTEKMIKGLQSRIPRSYFTKLHEKDNKTKCSPNSAIIPSSKPLPNSKERKLVALIHAYFDYNLTKFPKSKRKSDFNSACSFYFDLFGYVKGIKVLTKLPFTEFNCHHFVFNIYDWFEQNKATLLGEPEIVLEFLKKKNFLILEEGVAPAAGHVVLYHTDKEVLHYGIIDEETTAQTTIVRSKWGKGYIYQHRLEEVLPIYGIKYTVVIPPFI